MDEKMLVAIRGIPEEELCVNGAKPREYIFNRAVARNEKEGGVGSKIFSSVEGRPVGGGPNIFSSTYLAAEELVWANVTAQNQNGYAQDTIAVANNIAYYADGLDVYYGYTWKWEDGWGDTIERIYSAAATVDEMLVPEDDDENDETQHSEPYSPPRKVS